ncbi:CHAD domain-containing protein [Martelella alba]|uniref:CHAD domain-containing protein n=1 Tax=Martelella alba TaxID=2590451 RepID=A0A506UH72_9HYPH|nr:CHAD domain-containing protein [Martelella alba]TPW32507.1 CHAD domain-containing protein [Martelella alba]
MAFEIDPDKPFNEAFRAVATEELTKAITLLTERPDGLHEAVHAARKRFKRLRGLYRFARADAKGFARRENARIREMSASLSAERDATALIETVGYLRGLGPDGSTDMALYALERALTVRRDDIAMSDGALERKVTVAIGTCKAAMDAIKAHEFAPGRKTAASRIATGWYRMLSAAQVALMSARAGGTDEDFHELRKRSQDYWMFSSLAVLIWPSGFSARRERAKRLADLLGHEHDLSVLLALLGSTAGLAISDGQAGTVVKAALAERACLRKTAIKLARPLYSDDPDREAQVIERLWRG